ncbi:MAG: hypothetical protein QNJ55_25670 [Xenococcus sp. MO_188.B8]|nr:hypothetical protein [Xenococcus sp. MO_188.B8]
MSNREEDRVAILLKEFERIALILGILSIPILSLIYFTIPVSGFIPESVQAFLQGIIISFIPISIIFVLSYLFLKKIRQINARYGEDNNIEKIVRRLNPEINLVKTDILNEIRKLEVLQPELEGDWQFEAIADDGVSAEGICNIWIEHGELKIRGTFQYPGRAIVTWEGRGGTSRHDFFYIYTLPSDSGIYEGQAKININQMKGGFISYGPKPIRGEMRFFRNLVNTN